MTNPIALRNEGGMFVHGDEDEPQALGFLTAHGGEVYDAMYGTVSVEEEEAEEHNDLLSQALIDGLINTCEVGQGSDFFLTKKPNEFVLKTWTGQQLPGVVVIGNTSKTLITNGKAFDIKEMTNGGDGGLVHVRRIR